MGRSKEEEEEERSGCARVMAGEWDIGRSEVRRWQRGGGSN